MKTISIDKEDEARLAAVLREAGFEKYAQRIETAWSIFGGDFVSTNEPQLFMAGEPYENAFGLSGWADWSRGFATTGAIQTVSELKRQNACFSAVATIGWFRADDGHLCSSSCYPKYFGTTPQ